MSDNNNYSILYHGHSGNWTLWKWKILNKRKSLKIKSPQGGYSLIYGLLSLSEHRRLCNIKYRNVDKIEKYYTALARATVELNAFNIKFACPEWKKKKPAEIIVLNK